MNVVFSPIISEKLKTHGKFLLFLDVMYHFPILKTIANDLMSINRKGVPFP